MMNKLAQDIERTTMMKLAALSALSGSGSLIGGLGGTALGASVGGGMGTLAGLIKGIQENNQLKNMGLLEKAKRYLTGEQTSRTGLQNFGHVLKRGLQGGLTGTGMGGLGGGALGGLGGGALGEYLARRYPDELGGGNFGDFYKDVYDVFTEGGLTHNHQRPYYNWTRAKDTIK